MEVMDIFRQVMRSVPVSQNSQHSAAPSVQSLGAADWEIYDALPPRLRRMVQGSVLDPSPVPLQAKLNEIYRRVPEIVDHPDIAIEAIEIAYNKQMEEEVVAFGRAYERRWKMPYPHVAAKATLVWKRRSRLRQEAS